MSGEKKSRVERLREAEKKGEAELARFCWELFDELRTHRAKISGEDDATWNEWLERYDRRDSEGRLAKKGSGDDVIWETCENVLATMKEVAVEIEVFGRQADDASKSMLAQDLIDLGADQVKLPDLDAIASRWMVLLGKMIGKVFWSHAAEDGLGALDTRILDPRAILLDEDAKSVEDASIVIHFADIPIEKLALKYPNKVEAMKRGGRPRSDRSNLVLDTVKVAEIWIRDPKIEEFETDDGPKRREIYPEGRVLQVIGEAVPSDRANPFSRQEGGHGMFPFFEGDCFPVHDSAWPRGYVEMMWDDQCEIDKIDGTIATGVRLSSVTWGIIPAGVPVTVQQVANRPGIILRPRSKEQFDMIGFKQPPPPPQQLYDRAARLRDRMIKKIGGGEIDVSVISGRTQPVGTLELVKDTAEKRPRSVIDEKNSGWTRWGKLALACFRQFLAREVVHRISETRTIVIDPTHLQDLDVERFDLRFRHSGKTVRGRGTTFAMTAELDRIQVLGEQASMRRRRLLAESSGVKGAIELLNEEEEEMRLAAEMAAEGGIDPEAALSAAGSGGAAAAGDGLPAVNNLARGEEIPRAPGQFTEMDGEFSEIDPAFQDGGIMGGV